MIKVERIAVIGAGAMGSGIAQVAAQAGYQVALQDVKDEFLQRGFEEIRKSLGKMKDKGKVSLEEVKQILGRVKGVTDLKEATSNVDLVIEAVPEVLELKKQVFKSLDETCPQECILATNTSSLSISAIASVTKRPDKVIGMHFAYPVPVIAGVELIRGRDTSDETYETAKEVCKKLGKETFFALDFPGFAGNRLFPLFLNEAFYVVWEGISTPEDLDRLVKVLLRHPMGPLELADLGGLDLLLNVLEYLHKEMGEKYRPCPLLKQLVAAGHLGRKTGRGVYKYD